MLSNGKSKTNINHMDAFYAVLENVWDRVAKQFDVVAELPESRTLLEHVEPFDPCMAAEIIIRNMLVEITQLVHRFSPWYKLPARSFGLMSFRDILTHKNEWRLAPEAIEKWTDEIEMIASEIDQKNGILKMIMFVSDIDILEENPEDTIIVVCECDPPVELLGKREFLESRNIVCNECHKSFSPQAER